MPPNVAVEYCQEDYDIIYPKAVSAVNHVRHAKGLFFIDPYSYKDIKPEDIRKMLYGGNTEVLLWLPISFMYRFADSALRSDFKGSEPLKGLKLRRALKIKFGEQKNIRRIYFIKVNYRYES